MKQFKFTINGHTYEVDILGVEKNIASLEVNGTHYDVEIQKDIKDTQTPAMVQASSTTTPVGTKEIKPPVARASAPKVAPAAASGGGEVTSTVNAPLPGSIISISVKEGDVISKGDIILIMEAMKMENNILAESDGTVKSIKVAPGDAVLQNDVLVEIA